MKEFFIGLAVGLILGGFLAYLYAYKVMEAAKNALSAVEDKLKKI